MTSDKAPRSRTTGGIAVDQAPVIGGNFGLIWRAVCQPARWWLAGVVGTGGALSGRHGPKVQSGRLRVRLIFEVFDLKTLYSSRLAV